MTTSAATARIWRGAWPPLLCAALSLSGAATPAAARSYFNRVASFPVAANLPSGAPRNAETAAEIVAATPDGKTLVYTDSPLKALGLIDISDPAAPKPGGVIQMTHAPTSVAMGGRVAYVALNASESYTEPAGALAAVDIDARYERERCDLGGQPDSVAIAPDGGFLAIAVENERNEKFEDGAIPQLPAGFLTILPLKPDGALDCAAMKQVSLLGLAEVAGADPEPEFVDVNQANQIVVSLQENNHIVVVSKDGAVLSHFSAGAVDLVDADIDSDGALTFRGGQPQTPREPDGVQWLADGRIVTANEGDYDGGGRGFSIFSRAGDLLFESGPAFEHWMARIGHFPDKRASRRGAEPETVETARFGDQEYIFVAAERASAIAVYRDGAAAPEPIQVLPTGVGPEGLLALPDRALLVAANEADLREKGGPGSYVTIYAYQDAPPSYPDLIAEQDLEGRPIGWGALSGLTADPKIAGKLYAVSDGFYAAQPSIFEIDANRIPAAEITRRILVTQDGAAAPKLDLEGIAADGAGGFWLASEGDLAKEIPHRLLHVDETGAILREIPFPVSLLAQETRFGAEGIALHDAALWIVLQREWRDDPTGLVKLLRFDLATGAWSAVHYPLEPVLTGWVGLSEIAIHGDYAYVIERDNQIGAAARIKRLYRVPLADLAKAAPLGETPPLVRKELARDFLPDLTATGGFALDKIEGFTVDAAGVGYAVTDNDGVDGSSGETLFFSIGPLPGDK